jgi:hypothetical protein
MDLLQSLHRDWVEESLAGGRIGRDGKGTESIGAGDRGFVTRMKNQPGLRAKGPKVIEGEDGCRLQKPQFP